MTPPAPHQVQIGTMNRAELIHEILRLRRALNDGLQDPERTASLKRLDECCEELTKRDAAFLAQNPFKPFIP